MHSEAGGERARDGADTAARRDESEQPRRLVRGEHIDHQAPEHRDHEQVRDAEPPVVGRGERATLRRDAKQRLEQHDVDYPEPEHARQQTLEPHARGQPGVNGRREERADESAREQILQLVRSKHRRSGVAHGSKNVVAAHHHEVAQERERDGATLLGLDTSGQIEQAREARRGWRGSQHARLVLDRCSAPLPAAPAPAPPGRLSHALRERRMTCGASPGRITIARYAPVACSPRMAAPWHPR